MVTIGDVIDVVRDRTGEDYSDASVELSHRP